MDYRTRIADSVTYTHCAGNRSRHRQYYFHFNPVRKAAEASTGQSKADWFSTCNDYKNSAFVFNRLDNEVDPSIVYST